MKTIAAFALVLALFVNPAFAADVAITCGVVWFYDLDEKRQWRDL